MCGKKNFVCFIKFLSLLLAFTACSGSAQVNKEQGVKDLKNEFLEIQGKLPEALINDEFEMFIEQFDVWEKKFNAFKERIAGKIVSEHVLRDIDFLNIEVQKINLLKE